MAAGLGALRASLALSYRMADAADRFLAALDSDVRRRAVAPLDSEQRTDWNYLPHGTSQPVGVRTGELSGEQRESGYSLAGAGLSAAGLEKTKRIVRLDDHLRRITGRNYDSGHYWFTVFGEPADTAAWGWRFEGHHLSLNFTITPEGVSATPLFLGANPAVVLEGPREGLRVLGDEYDLAVDLMMSLDTEQRMTAVISGDTFGDIVHGMVSGKAPFDGDEGISAAELDDSQRELLDRLVGVYLGNLEQSLAEKYRAAYRKHLPDDVQFAWAGGMEPAEACYYRIVTPELTIEFDNSQRSAAGGGYNHYHTVIREPGGDFGEDILRRHYEESPHHQR